MTRHRCLVQLRWADMDSFGHVNNVQFLRLLEEARVLLLSAPGSTDGRSILDSGVVVARAEIEYLSPLVYRPEPVAIDMWVTRLSGASFDIGYEVLDPSGRDGREPDLYARAETTLVLYDLQTQRSRRMSEAERLALKEWEDDPVEWRRRR
jgi:acyl-CoA thioester hydrolase